MRTDGHDGDVFCVFDATDGLSGVAMTTWRDPGGDLFGDLGDGVPGAAPVDLEFADEAIWSSTLTSLYARTGDQVVTVVITDVGQVIADPLAAAGDLASIALG